MGFNFEIVAPLLNNYRYSLFYVKYKAIYYPCKVLYQTITFEVSDEEGLLAELVKIFNDSETKRVISSLLGQSKTEPSTPSDDDLPF